MCGSSPFHSVIIVGAGISGLTAARELIKDHADILIVEARKQIGGRVKEIEGLLPWSVSLGPEFIHGANSSLKAILDELKCNTTERSWPDCWYFKDERRLKPPSEKDADVEAVLDRFSSIGDQSMPEDDISAEEWLRHDGASDRQVQIADACIANDFGCSINQLGLRETILENQKWDAGEEYLLLDRSVSRVTDHLARSTDANILLDWPVHTIEYSASGAELTGLGGRKLRCGKVILTVPIKCLQDGGIQFKPQLPPWKASAIGRIKMSNAVKVIIVLDRAMWPEDFFDVVCPGSFFPEMWVTRYPANPGSHNQQLFGITAFACGLRAEEMSRMREASVILATLRQLDEMFGPGCKQKNPATQAFVRAHVADWSREEFIGGAYTYPSLGAELGDRDSLARPVGKVLYFAGEATHPAVNPCLQAAMETGLRAAAQVRDSRPPRSRL